MKISCQACEAKYTIADEKVQGKVAKIRCKKCGATIVVNGNASGEAAPADAGEGGLVYTVSVSDGDQRTMSVAEIVTAYNTGEITGETYLWADGMDDWLPLASVPAILEALNAAPSEPAADPARAASRRDGSRAGFDLFGGGGEPAPAPAEEPSFDAPMGGGSAAAATGARNEQSVLFSLNALVNADRKSAPPNASKTKDDSGLIDLGALAAKASSEPVGGGMAEPMLPMAPMLGAPLLAPPPVASAAVPVAAAAPPPQSKTGMYVGGAIVFATLVGAGVFVATRPKEQPPAPVVAATTAPTATETAPAPTATSTAVDPTAAVTASATATATATARVVGKSTGGGTKATAKTADKPPTAAPPATTAAKPPSSGNCGCPPGDLNCAIKCSATKKK
jgi:predicted Zn finger-like uncharacterized protein